MYYLSCILKCSPQKNNGTIWREQMARERWKCPYDDYKQEYSRKWNLQRHIITQHGGEGKPVKNKSSADTENSTWDIQHTGNTFKNLYTSHPNSSYSLPSQYYDPSTIKGLYPKNQTAKEENNKKGQEVKTTDDLDPVDVAYQKFKKYKDRNDKVEEMINYFANNNSRILFPSQFPLDIFNHHPNPTFDPPVGFRTYICADCLTAPIDPVKLSDLIRLGPLTFTPKHTCKQKDLQNRKRAAEKN
jgi:hypothetical protein